MLRASVMTSRLWRSTPLGLPSLHVLAACFLNRWWWACTMTPSWGKPRQPGREAGGAESEECFCACGLLWGEGARDVAGERSELVGVDSCRSENSGAKDCVERSASETAERGQVGRGEGSVVQVEVFRRMGSVGTSILEDLDVYPRTSRPPPTTPSTAKSPLQLAETMRWDAPRRGRSPVSCEEAPAVHLFRRRGASCAAALSMRGVDQG